MKAAMIREFGDVDVLKYGDLETPRPRPGHILIKVLAAGINRFDHYIREGSVSAELPFPHILGADAAGEVPELGKGVSGFKTGDRVIPTPGFPQDPKEYHIRPAGTAPSFTLPGLGIPGTYAQYIEIPAEWVLKDPTGLTRQKNPCDHQGQNHNHGRRYPHTPNESFLEHHGSDLVAKSARVYLEKPKLRGLFRCPAVLLPIGITDFLQLRRLLDECGPYRVDFGSDSESHVRILKQELGPATFFTVSGRDIENPVYQKAGRVDRIGIGGSNLIGDPAMLQREAPVIDRPGHFLSLKLFAWNNRPRITAVEVKNRKRHHDQSQHHRDRPEYVFHHTSP